MAGPTDDPPPGPGEKRGRSPMAFASVGIELLAPLLLFLLLGHWLDRRVGTAKPWFLLAGAVLGIALGLYSVLRRLISSRGAGG